MLQKEERTDASVRVHRLPNNISSPARIARRVRPPCAESTPGGVAGTRVQGGVAASWLLQSDGDHLHGWQWLRLSVLTQCLQRTDLPLSQHCLRVQRTARQLARHLALSHEEMTAVELAAPFHDLGKLGLAPTILHKAAPLTAQEFEEVKQHSALRARMLRSLGISEQVASGVYHHHERWDGSGYPDGLRGSAIPLGVQIIAITDAFDAMTAHRPYQPARTRPRRWQNCSGVGEPTLTPAWCSSSALGFRLLPADNVPRRRSCAGSRIDGRPLEACEMRIVVNAAFTIYSLVLLHLSGLGNIILGIGCAVIVLVMAIVTVLFTFRYPM